jgi:hypothetical protein
MLCCSRAPEFTDVIVQVSSAVADHAYSIEAYWKLNPMKKFWIPLAMSDPALLNAILFCGDQFEARMRGIKERPSAIKYLKCTIQILHGRLSDPLEGTSDSTIATVALLALIEVNICISCRSNWY